MKVPIAGASGFVGRRLCAALAAAGHDVVAMTCNPAGYAGTGTPAHADVHDPHTLGAAMAGCQVAYYLVHSLAQADFEPKDAAAAVAFGEAGARVGLQQIIYLGGLGDDRDALSAPSCLTSVTSRAATSTSPACWGSLHPSGRRSSTGPTPMSVHTPSGSTPGPSRRPAA